MKKIINEKLIFSKNNLKDKTDLFNAIVDVVEKNGRTTDKKKLFKNIFDREKLSSTAFENGLIMPHARSRYINDITLVITKFNDLDFNSIDSKPSNFSVAILVPEISEDKHLTILSKLSSLFSSKEKLAKFKKLTKKEMISSITSAIDSVEEKSKTTNSDYDIVGISSCAAGIAHTYMARDALIMAAKRKGLKIKIETQGAVTEDILTPSEIENAKAIIIAADVRIEKDRFMGKKLYETSTNDAIKNGDKIIGKTLKADVFGKSKEKNIQKKPSGKDDEKLSPIKKFGREVSGALMTAVSYMLPIIVAGALLFAIPTAISAATGHRLADGTYKNGDLPKFLQALQDFGLTGFTKLAIPIIGMYVAYAIGGKPAMAAGLIGTFFANDGAKLYKWSYLSTDGVPQSAGFFGAILIGLFAGYLVKYMKWIKWHRWIKPASGIIIIPLISTFLTFIFVVYIVGAPVAWLMSKIYDGLGNLNGSSKWAVFGIGALFGGMIAFDFGGPIGKIAWFVGNGIFVDTVKAGDPNLMPISSVAAAISLAPIGVFIATRMFRRKFTKSEIQAGSAALPLGLIGISEGALPFAFKDPFKLIFANVIAGILTSGTVAALGIIQWGGLGSPIGGWLGYTENSFYGILWCLIIVAGCFVTGTIFGLLKKGTKQSKLDHEEYKKEKVILWESRGIKSESFNFHKKFAYSLRMMISGFIPKAKIVLNPKNWFEKPKDW